MGKLDHRPVFFFDIDNCVCISAKDVGFIAYICSLQLYPRSRCNSLTPNCSTDLFLGKKVHDLMIDLISKRSFTSILVFMLM